MTNLYPYPKRRRYRSTSRKPATKQKPVAAATLARREKLLTNLIGLLRQLESDPEYVEAEAAKQSRIREIDHEINSLRTVSQETKRSASTDAMQKIGEVYRRALASFRDYRSWWQRLQDPVTDFKYSLPSSESGQRPYSPTGSNYGQSFGHLRQSQDTWQQVRVIEDVYLKEYVGIEMEAEERIAVLTAEKEKLVPRKVRHKTPSDIPQLEQELAECRRMLTEASLDEQQLRSLYGVDDTTIAKAAAYSDKTRKLATKLRPTLLPQLEKSARCPYCQELLDKAPHVDHIVPVSLGGLSTANNLVFVCSSCNLKKSDMTLREFFERFSLDRESVESNLLCLGKRV